MRQVRKAGAATVVLALLLAVGGCSDQLGDRGGDEGAAPDKISDVDYVEVFRNADNFPNVAMVCIRGIAFATTASREGYSAPALIRTPEWDARCAAVPGGAPPSAPAGGSPSPAAS